MAVWLGFALLTHGVGLVADTRGRAGARKITWVVSLPLLALAITHGREPVISPTVDEAILAATFMGIVAIVATLARSIRRRPGPAA